MGNPKPYLYSKTDPRDIPTYTIGDADRYLRIPPGTIRSWTLGRKASTAKGKKHIQPLIQIPEGKPRLLSFTNLVEVHVLRALRQHHKIQLDKVRTALNYTTERLGVPHPLARDCFQTDGTNLFVHCYGDLINASQDGQLALKEALSSHLERIELDDSGLAIRLFPFTRSREETSPRLVAVDPRSAYGQLAIVGTGIPTSIISERYRAGESIEELAYDYDCKPSLIEEAIRCELPVAA